MLVHIVTPTHGDGAYASTDDLHRQGQRGHVDPASNGLVSREKGYGCPDKWRAQSLGALRKCAQVLRRPGAYARDRQANMCAGAHRHGATRGSVVIVAGPRLRIWARELESRIHGLFFFETLC